VGIDPYARMKQAMRWMWSLGDYGELAPILEPAAQAIIERCIPGPGTVLLDVAAGTGNVALLAARRGAHVIACDLTPRRIDLGGPAPNGVAFDPSGPRIAMVGPKGLVEIRDVESGSRVAVLHGPSGGVTGVAFSPDGSRVAVPHTDGTVRLFEADTGAQQLVLPGFGCTVSRVAFSPDGTKLASASPCGGLRIWALDIDDLLEIADREVPRALTDQECRQYLHVGRCSQAHCCVGRSLGEVDRHPWAGVR